MQVENILINAIKELENYKTCVFPMLHALCDLIWMHSFSTFSTASLALGHFRCLCTSCLLKPLKFLTKVSGTLFSLLTVSLILF
jgi:hypothetical protein